MSDSSPALGSVSEMIMPTRGPSSGGVEKIASLVRSICVAFSNIHVFSFVNDVSRKSFEQAWEDLHAVLEERGEVIVSFASGKLVFSGMPVEERNKIVARFADHLAELHITSLRFEPGLTREELRAFFAVVCREASEVEEAGGVEAMFEAAAIEHIARNTSFFEMIGEDEKIVKKSARVDAGAKVEDADRELVDELLQELLLREADDEDFFLELRRDPGKLAEKIVEVMRRADSVRGAEREEVLQALLRNIEILSVNMERHCREVPNATEDLGKSMTELEQELRRRAKALGSKETADFLRQMTQIISMYSARAKAGLLMDEFLEHEQSLEVAESLLKEMAPDTKAAKTILESLRETMAEQGVEAEELVNLLEEHIEKASSGRKRASKTFRPLAERVEAKVAAVCKGLPKEQQEKLVAYLDNAFAREIKRAVREATRDAESKLEETSTTILKMKHALRNAAIGLVLFGPGGIVADLQYGEGDVPGIEIGNPLPAVLAEALDALEPEQQLECGDICIVEVNRSDAGDLESFLFQPVESPSA